MKRFCKGQKLKLLFFFFLRKAVQVLILDSYHIIF